MNGVPIYDRSGNHYGWVNPERIEFVTAHFISEFIGVKHISGYGVDAKIGNASHWIVPPVHETQKDALDALRDVLWG